MTQEEQLTMGVVVLLALLLVFFWVFRPRAASRPALRSDPPGPRKWVIIDGSNVMHWQDGKPRTETVGKVIDLLIAHGFTPGVMFDANAGYLLIGKYQHDGALSRALGLPEDRVMVVPKGTPADPAILSAARDYQARIVTNDRFRDWVAHFPEIRKRGHLIRGGFRSGTLTLDLSPGKDSQPRRKRATP